MLFNKFSLVALLLLSLNSSQSHNLEEKIQQPLEYHHPAEPLLVSDETKRGEIFNLTDRAIKEISRVELAMFIEGLLYGIVNE